MAISGETVAIGPVAEAPAASSYRWIVLLLAWGAFLLSYVDRLAWSNVAVPVGQSLALPVAALGIFVTAFYIGYVASNALGGFLTDVLGARLLLSATLLLLGLLTFLFSFTNSIAMGLVIQAAMGLVAGADYAAGVKLIAAWFTRREFGRAMGLFMTASSLGVVVTNFLVPPALQSLGWSGVYQLFGAGTCVMALLCLLIVRDAPASIGARVHGRPDLAKLFRNRDLLLLSVAGFGALWGTWGFAFWASALMIKGHGFSAVAAGQIVGSFGVGAIFGKPLVGLVSDWLGGMRRIPVIVCLVAFVAMLLIFGGLATQTQFLIAAPFLGVAAFVYSPLMNTMVAELAGVREAGSAAGITNAIWQIGSVIVPVVVGLVFSQTQSFYAAFLALAAGPLVGTLAMLAVKQR